MVSANTIKRFENLLGDVTYKDWSLIINQRDGTAYLQWAFTDVDPVNGVPELQSCRKWQLSPYMTDSEIVATAFKAALSAEEHECRETFKYQGLAIYGTHTSLSTLVEMAQNRKLDRRRPH